MQVTIRFLAVLIAVVALTPDSHAQTSERFRPTLLSPARALLKPFTLRCSANLREGSQFFIILNPAIFPFIALKVHYAVTVIQLIFGPAKVVVILAVVEGVITGSTKIFRYGFNAIW